MAELLEELGGIDPRRVPLNPPPGKATENDVVRIQERSGRLFELVDGVLVEKVMGLTESSLAMWLGHLLQRFLDGNALGFLAGEAGAMRLMPGLIRIPDVSFISWDRVPVRGEVPDKPIADLAPDLAVEVLSKGNTPKEMARKLKEYFLAGVRLVWFVDRKKRTVEIFTSPDESHVFSEGETLDGGDVLPGLALLVGDIFALMPGGVDTPSTPRGKKRRGGAK
jgi:Uma2 family endonuclease